MPRYRWSLSAWVYGTVMAFLFGVIMVGSVLYSFVEPKRPHRKVFDPTRPSH